jgi:ADP-ribose pyrophosphatase YjhB (NUDIX family)
VIRPIILANYLVKKDGKYLLVQEATDKVWGNINTHSKGKWTFPHGEVDKGETIREAAERKLVEETGGRSNFVRLGAIAHGLIKNTVYFIGFVFYGEGFEEIGLRWEHEIKATKWFSRKEIIDLEKQGLVRDNVPLSRIIDAVEMNSGVDFIEWEQPDYVIDILNLLEKRNVEKESRS